MTVKTISVGIDFDNTIACYNEIFHQVAVEKNCIPSATPKSKASVRNYLREAGEEDLWTEIQGYIYGARMADVKAFPGALECIASLKANGIPVVIISHKTRYPYKGKAYDLHAAAKKWLRVHGLSLDGVFFKETKQEKLSQIAACECTHFIDDLPEFLAEEAFPRETKKILFSPEETKLSLCGEEVTTLSSWQEITEHLLTP